ncbi:transporter [Thalassotalea mangrovi]|uniref:Transporter n=1 Tax=Thalassotalea mangrovi TaxID=2572245 RepID=A0A4U1B305_9GAMM|nr:transporter [Thalassotalea mangrovi]TKB43982.1 transporter [Thalassotalea mangrovi]
MRLVCSWVLILFIHSYAQGQDLEPRSYLNVPVDQTFFTGLYIYSDGDVYTASSLPISDFRLQTTTWAGQFTRTFELDNKMAKFDAMFVQSCGDGSATFQGEFTTRKFCGLADSKLKFSYNFAGSPALTAEDFRKYQKTTIYGASIQVNVPNGHYEKDKLLNIGSNRWYIKPEIGATIPFENWEIDLAASLFIFEDNDELLGNQTLSQDNVYNLQFHLVYDLGPAHWLALALNYFGGGDTFVDGEPSGLKETNMRGGIAYRYSFNPHHSVKVIVNTGLTTRLGNDSDAITLAWTYRL